MTCITRKDVRSVRLRRNIIGSFVIRSISVPISLAIVRSTLGYLGSIDYGVWLVVSGLVGWIGYLDFGLSNGLRNKYAEALAKGDERLAGEYTSTAFFALSAVMLVLCATLACVTRFIDWATLLNADRELSQQLAVLVLVVCSLTAFSLVVQLAGVILVAEQRSALGNGFGVAGTAVSLVVVYALAKVGKGSLLSLGVAMTAPPAVVWLGAMVFIFSSRPVSLRLRWKYVNLGHLKALATVGTQFFLIRVAGLVLFSTDNLIITRLFGPADVTPYNIAFKYFGLSTTIFTVIAAPYWSAYTEAYVAGDFSWIKVSLRRLLLIWIGLVLVILLMLGFSSRAYDVWIGPAVRIPFYLSAGMALFCIIGAWNMIFASCLNGVGKVRLQLYGSLIAAAANVPLSIFLARSLNLGSTGVIIATSVCLVVSGAVMHPVQVYKIIHGRARGVWQD